MLASDTEVLRFETSMHQILKLHVATAQGTIHGEPARAAGLFWGKRADTVYKSATAHGNSGEKRVYSPKTDTPILFLRASYNTCRSVTALYTYELSLISARKIICSMLAFYQKDGRIAGNDSVICS